jgi:hypothetical protein
MVWDTPCVRVRATRGNFTIGIDQRGKHPRFNFRFTIGLHIDDKPLLEKIKSNLGCVKIVNNKNNTASNFFITNTTEIKSILFSIFYSFPLNTTKYLDYLNFKEALLLNEKRSDNKIPRSPTRFAYAVREN